MLCTLCPRRCGALRTASAGSGFCRMPSLPVVARAMLHHWEEPCISGTNGSGAVFFSGCVLGCVFCQNGPISKERFGKTISVSRLRGIFEALIAQGAHNINLVSPTPFVRWRSPCRYPWCGIPEDTSGRRPCGPWRAGCRSGCRT